MSANHTTSRAACAYCGEDARPNAMYCMSCGQILTPPQRATAASRPVATPAAVPQGFGQTALSRPAQQLLPQPVPPPMPSMPAAPHAVGRSAAAPAAPPAAPQLLSDDAQIVELVLVSGARTRVHGTAVLGRHPEATARNAGAQAIEIPDPTKSVSRAHAIIEFQGLAVAISDAGSANGSSVERDGNVLDLSGDRRISLRHGDLVWLGDVPVEVQIVQGRRGAHA